MKRMLVIVDFSNCAAEALQYAHQLAMANGARIDLLHCFPEESYNRPYDFPGQDYQKGIQAMLKSFHQDWVGKPSVNSRYLALPGSLQPASKKLSPEYDLMVINAAPDSQDQIGISIKATAVASASACPVLIVPPATSFTGWSAFWYIKRGEVSKTKWAAYLQALDIDPTAVQEKSFTQKKFQSNLWRQIVNWRQQTETARDTSVLDYDDSELLDLILIARHQEEQLTKFLRDDAVQFLSRNGIPFLILPFSKV